MNNQDKPKSITPTSSSNALSVGTSSNSTLIMHVVVELIIIGIVFYLLNKKITALDQRVAVLENKSSSSPSTTESDESLDKQQISELLVRIKRLESIQGEVGTFMEEVESEFMELKTKINSLESQLSKFTKQAANSIDLYQKPPVSVGKAGRMADAKKEGIPQNMLNDNTPPQPLKVPSDAGFIPMGTEEKKS